MFLLLGRSTVSGTGASGQGAQIGNGVGTASATNGFLLPNQPNIIDFWYFLRTSVRIPIANLPNNSPFPQYALDQAIILTLCAPVGILYTLAVYNCATHIVYKITPDTAASDYFRNARSAPGKGGNGSGGDGFALVAPSTGLVAASSDETTSSTLTSPDWAKRLTIGELDFFRTPWGRTYLEYQQSYGPTIIDLT